MIGDEDAAAGRRSARIGATLLVPVLIAATGLAARAASPDVVLSAADRRELETTVARFLSWPFVLAAMLYATKSFWADGVPDPTERVRRPAPYEEPIAERRARLDPSLAAMRRMDLAAAVPIDGAVRVGLTSIRFADRAFDLETFLQRAETTYFLVRRAYRIRKPEDGRAFLAPELYAAWSENLAALRAERRRPVLEDLNVRALRIVAARRDADAAEIVVHYDCSAAERIVAEADGAVAAGTTTARRFGERWTFARAPNATTRVDGGVTARRCPSCGAPLALRDLGTACTHCGADVASGAEDWTVRAIEGAPFLGGGSYPLLDAAPMLVQDGFRAIRAADPAFSPERLLKRTSTAFALLGEAWRRRDLDAARPFMSPGVYLALRTRFEQLADEGRTSVHDRVSVELVEPLLVVRGKTFENVVVRITARRAEYEVATGTKRIVAGDRTVREHAETWTLQRAIGTRSVERGIPEKRCPNCGAPLEITQIGECRYCEAAVTSGRFDWVISHIERADDPATL